MKRTIRFKLGLSMLILLILSFTIITILGVNNFTTTYKNINDESIDNAINKNLYMINSLTDSMEQKAADLAVTGTAYYLLMKNIDNNENIYEEVMNYLINSFEYFPTAVGGGVWFEPDTIVKDNRYFGPYVFWDNGVVTPTWDLNSAEYDYLNQGWYTFALPENWNRKNRRDKEYYWSEPYVDEAGTGALMITVSAFIYDEKDTIIGISTIDWGIDDMLKKIKEIKISPNSNSFLIESTSGTIMANTYDETTVMTSVNSIPWIKDLKDKSTVGVIKKEVIELDGEKSNLYYIKTNSGMIFGQLLPLSDYSLQIDINRNLFIIVSIIFVAIMFITLQILVTKTTKPLKNVDNTLNEIANGKGDLTVNIDIKSEDEIGSLSASFNTFVGTLRIIVSNILKSSQNIINVKDELTSEVNQTATVVTEISSNMDSSRKSMDNLNDTINITRDNSTHINSGIEQLREALDNQNQAIEVSSAAINQMVASIDQVALTTRSKQESTTRLLDNTKKGEEVLHTTTTAISEIDSSVEIISEMTGIINGIADQTNLLAMNAAIEAAHAGDAGKGFSVVADEIRKLAENSSDNATKISGEINNIIKKIETAVISGEKTSSNFKEIHREVEDVYNTFSEILSAFSELSTGGEQILEGVNILHDVSMRVNTGAEIIEDGSKTLGSTMDQVDQISNELTGAITEVTTGAAEISRVMNLISELIYKLDETSNNLEKDAGEFIV